MSNKLRHIGTRVDESFYEKIKQHVHSLDVSISDFVRTAVEQTLAGPPTDVKSIESVISVFREQLSAKDEQIAHLHQLLAMGGKERERLAEQLDRSNLQLEDLRTPRTAWQRIRAIFAPEPGARRSEPADETGR
jgi:uncharacterized FAD-dependent dehydrogenase